MPRRKTAYDHDHGCILYTSGAQVDSKEGSFGTVRVVTRPSLYDTISFISSLSDQEGGMKKERRFWGE